MRKYFTQTVKPTITASKQTGAFADADVLFDWTAFDIPRGAVRLISITSLIRGTNGTDQAGGFDFELFFAKSNPDSTAPTTLGDLNDAVDTPGWFNNIIGRTEIDASASSNDGDLIYMNVMSTVADSIHWKPLVLQGEPDSAAATGYDRLYVAGISKAAFDFSTEVDIGPSEGVDISGSNGTLSVIDGTDPRLVFAPGDIIHAQDDIIIGEVASLDANNITFKFDGSATTSGTGYTVPASLAAWRIQNGADAAGDLAENDELYNINPITLIFSFEV